MAKMYEVTIEGRYLNQMIINRLGFVSSNDIAATATAFSLARALGIQAAVATGPLTSSVLHRYLQAQTNLYQATQLMVRNLFGPTDFWTASLSGTVWAGEAAAGVDGIMPFVAAKLRTNRVNQDIRRGTLALTALGEENYGADGVIAAGYLTVLNNLAIALNAPPTWTSGSDSTQFFPAVFQKQEYVVPNRTDGRTAWKYYADPAVQLEHTAFPVTWEPVGTLTSQVSRRIGKGA